jgi:hypothetical protein
MALNIQSIPPELARLTLDIRRSVETVEHHIEARNYGLAADWLKETKKLLPIDVGPYDDWMELERRTGGR